MFYGYCPGTAIGSIATGSVHALVGAFGMIFGAIVYALTFDWVKSHILNVWALGKVRLPDITGVPDAAWFLALAVIGAAFFYWAILAQADGIVRHHVDDAHAHQCGKPDGRTALVGEGEKRAAVGNHAAVERKAVHRGRHAELADAIMDVGAGKVARADRLLLMQQLVEEAGFRPKIGMEIDSNETIKQAVMAGLGIAFISAHTVASEIQHGRLAALDVVGLPVIRQWFVLRRVDKHLLPPGLALLEFLSREAAQFLPNALPQYSRT